jgi:transmembrane protein TMEM260 (protein O-mannosyltransferase)
VGAATVFVVAFSVYIRTLAPSVGLIDSGELTAAAWCLGNAHAPGFPFYLLATRAVMLVPIGSIAVRANAASALFAALAAALIGLLAAEIASSLRRRTEPEPSAPLLTLFAGFLFAFSRTMWAYATIAEVYALNACLLAAVLLCVVTWRRNRDDRLLYAAALFFGLGLAVHHVTIGLTLPAIAWLVVRTQFRWRTLAITFVIAVAALLVYAYEPWAAHRKPPVNWGNPGDAQHFVAHVTGKQYREFINPSRRNEQFGSAIDYLGKDLGVLGVLLAVGGALVVFVRDKTLFTFLILIAAADVGWITLYWIINDQDAYLLPAIVTMIVAAAAAGARLVPPRWSAALLIVPIIAVVTAWPVRDRSRYTVAADYATDALTPMRPNALLLTNDWQLYSPLMYFIEVEKRRPDVTYISTGSLIRSWYLDYIDYRYPALCAAVRPQLDAFRPWVTKWEHTSAADWNADAASRDAFFARLHDLVVAMASRQIASGRPVYASIDFVRGDDAGMIGAASRLRETFAVVPRGVVVEYAAAGTAPPIDPSPLHTAALHGGYEPNDVVVTSVIPTYAAAYLMRARALVFERRYAAAVGEYERGLALKGEDASASRELRLARQASRR